MGSLGMTPEQISIITSTVPVLAEHGLAITTVFYKRLFEAHPELRNVFNVTHQATGEQQKALAHALYAYASHISNPGALQAAISRIANKHASLSVKPEHYDVVGKGVLSAMKEVLGEAATDPIVDAWGAAYSQLAAVFIQAERDLYSQSTAAPGGWAGWRKFVVSNKVSESEEATSFYLTPADNGALPAYKPGQFVSVQCFVPELGVYQPRQYSLSDFPGGKAFRISVKKMVASEDKPAGHISSFLHDSTPVGAEIDVSMPFGDFVLDIDATTPVVLVSGGVGLTPVMSMLKAIVAHGQSRKVAFVHAARNGRVHAMKSNLADILSKNPQVARAVFYEDVSEGDNKQGVDHDFVGRIDLAKIKDTVLMPDADYYICGPPPFMKIQSEALQGMGVDAGKIHMEVFGSTVA